MQNNIPLIFVACLAVALTGYWFFGTGSTIAPPLSATEAADPAEQQFIALAQRLEQISFDVNIFNDPRFTSLVNLATPINPEPLGRVDPFALLGPINPSTPLTPAPLRR